MAVALPLVIDRIHMTVGVTSKKLYSYLISQLYGLLDIQGTLLPKGKLSIIKEDYETRLDFWPVKGRKIAEVICGSTKSKHLYFKLVLYPAKFRHGEFEHIKFLIEVLLSKWSYPILFSTANVPYVEIARDFLNKDYLAYFPYFPGARKSEVVFEKNGDKGSTYIGAYSSSKRFNIYDKARQLTSKKGGSNFIRLMRVEARLKKTGLKPFELLEKLENPFDGLEFLSAEKLLCISDDDGWAVFVEQCRCVGTAQALYECEKQVRKIYKARLASAKVDWWDASKAWEGWPNAFAAILP